MIDIVMQNNAIVLETKVNVLAHIGVIPGGSAAVMVKLEVAALLAAVNSNHTPDDIVKEAGNHISQMSLLMNDGLIIVKKKMASDECVKCGKCEGLTTITEMLLENNPPIHEVHDLIQKHWGDIKGDDLSTSYNPMIALIQALSGSAQAPAIDTTGSVGSNIESIMSKIFGKKPDTSKLH